MKARFRIGIDLGGSKIEIAALDGAGQARARRRVPTPAGDYDATIAAIGSLVVAVENEIGAGGSVGIGIPGTVVERTGLVKNANSTCLIGRPLRRDVEAVLGRPVRFANDVATRVDRARPTALLPERREPYWTVISEGCALGYRRGAKGGTWIAKYRDPEGKRHLEALGAADDARDADGLSVYSFAQAQERARAWFQDKAREAASDIAPLNRDYTVSEALAEYRADYLRRGGKAVDRLDWSAAAWIAQPECQSDGIPADPACRP